MDRDRRWTLLIRRPADAVYRRLADFAAMPEYLDGIAAVERPSNDILRLSPGNGAGEWEVRITEAVPGRALRFEPVDPHRPAMRFVLEAGEGSTAVTVHVTGGADQPPGTGFVPDADRLRAHLEAPGEG